MIISLFDMDKTKFPNLALLKLSAWHKRRGDDVLWNNPWVAADVTLSSRNFMWSPDPPHSSIKGGWVDNMDWLPDEVEHICPDYEGMTFSLGFLSRGCIRKCSFCVVPKKEGDIQPWSKLPEFLRHDHGVFLDNNWLASPRWEEDFIFLHWNRIWCDFNQGLDSRLITPGIAKRLAGLNWKTANGRKGTIRMACDSQSQKEPLGRAVEYLRKYGHTGEIFVYVLGIEEEDSLDRIEFCSSIGAEPFLQPFRDFDTGIATRDMRRLARWCNSKPAFKSVSWKDYKAERGDRI